jgi:hypothetical protein
MVLKRLHPILTIDLVMVQNVHVRTCTSHEQKKLPIQPNPNLMNRVPPFIYHKDIKIWLLFCLWYQKRLHPINID